MKKLLYLLTVAFVAVGLTACFSSRDVAKFSVGLNDKDGSTAVLTLTPDYSKRTFSVDYKKDFADKKQKSAAFSGQMGGESFDRFETMTKMVRNYKPSKVQLPTQVTGDVARLKATVEGTDKTTSVMDVSADDTAKDVQDLKAFYDDIVKLLTVSAPV